MVEVHTSDAIIDCLVLGDYYYLVTRSYNSNNLVSYTFDRDYNIIIDPDYHGEGCILVTIGLIDNGELVDKILFSNCSPVDYGIVSDNTIAFVLDRIVYVRLNSVPEVIHKISIDLGPIGTEVIKYIESQQSLYSYNSPRYLITPYVQCAYWYSVEPNRINYYVVDILMGHIISHSIHITLQNRIIPLLSQYSNTYCLVGQMNSDRTSYSIVPKDRMNICSEYDCSIIPKSDKIVLVNSIVGNVSLYSEPVDVRTYEGFPPSTERIGFIGKRSYPFLARHTSNGFMIQVFNGHRNIINTFTEDPINMVRMRGDENTIVIDCYRFIILIRVNGYDRKELLNRRTKGKN